MCFCSYWRAKARNRGQLQIILLFILQPLLSLQKTVAQGLKSRWGKNTARTKGTTHTNIPIKYHTTIINSWSWWAAGALWGIILGVGFNEFLPRFGPCGSLHTYCLPLFCLLIRSFLPFWLSVGKLVMKPCRWHLHFAAFKSQVQGAQLSLTQRFKDVSERMIPRRLMVCGWAPALLSNRRWSVEKQKLYIRD